MTWKTEKVTSTGVVKPNTVDATILLMMKRRRVPLVAGVSLGMLLAAGVGAGGTAMPKSPMATDALRAESGTIRDAAHTYWAACAKAEKRLANVLRTAAHAAHARNDGVEEQACLDAAKDAEGRYVDAIVAVQSGSAGPLKPFRFEKGK